MNLFYRYKCKKCGKMYKSLPIFCHSCNTELSFMCPLNMFIPAIAEYRPTKDCEEIMQFIFLPKKKQRIKELEEEIKRINNLESDYKREIEALGKDVSFYKSQNLKLEQLISLYKQMKPSTQVSAIPQGIIEAVKYAMKKAHPDNGGDEEKFKRFQKVYEELKGK